MFVCEGGGGGGLGWLECKKERKETPATKARVFCISPLISIIPAVTSLSIRRALFCITDFTRECIANGGFVAVEHEKIATPRKNCKRGRKPNVNVPKTAVLDSVALTSLVGEDEPHLKIYFRRRQKLKVQG